MAEAFERWEVKTGKASEILDAKPLLSVYDQDVWAGFKRLHNARQSGYGCPQKIVVSEMLQYAREFILDIDEFVEVVSALDSLWYKWWQDNKSDG